MDYDGHMKKSGITYSDYQKLHRWIYKNKGKATFCSIDTSHKSTRYHWSNISNKYLWDVNDFESLCPGCHLRKDMTLSTRQKFSRRSIGNNNAGKPIIKIYSMGSWIKFPSAREAYRKTGVSDTNINNVLRGLSKTAGGFKWKYMEV